MGENRLIEIREVNSNSLITMKNNPTGRNRKLGSLFLSGSKAGITMQHCSVVHAGNSETGYIQRILHHCDLCQIQIMSPCLNCPTYSNEKGTSYSSLSLLKHSEIPGQQGKGSVFIYLNPFNMHLSTALAAQTRLNTQFQQTRQACFQSGTV